MRLKRPGRESVTQSSDEAIVNSPQMEDRAAVPASGSDNAIQQADSPGTEKTSDVYIKQEPTSGTADVVAISPPNTVDPVNDIPNASLMSDVELSAYLEYYKKEEEKIPKKEAQGFLTELYDRQSRQIRCNIRTLEKERSMRQRILSDGLNASKSLGLGKLPVMQVTDAQQRPSLRQKRKRGHDGERNTRLKITKETRQIMDTAMKEAFSLNKGEVSAVYDKDATKALPQIDEAPAHLREHLRAIQNAALQNPGVKEDVIDHDIRAFAGILKFFGPLIQPWVSPGEGPQKIGDFKWTLAGMKEPLHHHQVPAIGVMLMNEKDLEKDGIVKFALRSGFLFDYMGLGKTVEILACIVLNSPVKRKGKRSTKGHTTTLIVVPKSAVLQWQNEAQRHCQDIDVGVYDREDSEVEAEETLMNDILIVTYDQLLAADRKASLKKKKQKGVPRKSLLFKSKFYRVVLDESHRIKSRDAETFRVCCKLQATQRWCASGTPTPNGIAELYSYLKFIQHPLVTDFPNFRDQYLGGKKGKLFPTGVKNKYEKLDRLLEHLMIMRTPAHKFLCGALVELPETHFHATHVQLSTEEEVIYKSVEAHIEEHINRKSGKEPKKKPSRPRKKPQDVSRKATDEDSGGLGYRSLYEVAMRLRQLVASPLLLEKLVKEGIWTAEQIRKMRDEAHNRGCDKTPFIDQFESWISEPKMPQTASKKANRLSRKAAEFIRGFCPGCGAPPQEEPHRSQCLCIWCKECVHDRIHNCVRRNEVPFCKRCKKAIGVPKPCELPRSLASKPGEPDSEHQRKRGEDFLGFRPKEDFESSLFRQLEANPEAEIPLSSKMRAILEQIQDWQTAAPQDKILVFSQFIDTLKLLGRVLQDHDIEFLYFVGELDYDQREAAKEQFRTNPNIKVMASIPFKPVS